MFTSDIYLKIHMDITHLEEDGTDNIVQLDGNDEIEKPKEDNMKKQTSSTFKFVSDMTEEKRTVHEKNQEDEGKADGSCCYECKDTFLNNTVVKMHMHNDHKSKAV